MPKERQYALCISAKVKDADGYAVAIHGPTLYLHANVQGITNEDHAKGIVTDWLAKLCGYMPDAPEFDVYVAETTVHSPDPQAEALLHRIKTSKCGTFAYEPFDLPEGYVLVRANDGFTCGVAPDGRVSS